MGLRTTLIASAAPLVVGMISAAISMKAAGKANTKRKRKRDKLRRLENERQGVINPYANLGVATQAAEMQAEETDLALASSLDALRATGMGAGGATALAQAAARSKQGIAADIQTQEATVQQLRAEGESWRWEQQESREIAGLARAAGQEQFYQQQKWANQAAGTSALMGGTTASVGVLGSFAKDPTAFDKGW